MNWQFSILSRVFVFISEIGAGYHERFQKPGQPNLILIKIKFIDKTEKKKERSKEKITQLVWAGHTDRVREHSLNLKMNLDEASLSVCLQIKREGYFTEAF